MLLHNLEVHPYVLPWKKLRNQFPPLTSTKTRLLPTSADFCHTLTCLVPVFATFATLKSRFPFPLPSPAPLQGQVAILWFRTEIHSPSHLLGCCGCHLWCILQTDPDRGIQGISLDGRGCARHLEPREVAHLLRPVFGRAPHYRGEAHWLSTARFFFFFFFFFFFSLFCIICWPPCSPQFLVKHRSRMQLFSVLATECKDVYNDYTMTMAASNCKSEYAVPRFSSLETIFSVEICICIYTIYKYRWKFIQLLF